MHTHTHHTLCLTSANEGVEGGRLVRVGEDDAVVLCAHVALHALAVADRTEKQTRRVGDKIANQPTLDTSSTQGICVRVCMI